LRKTHTLKTLEEEAEEAVEEEAEEEEEEEVDKTTPKEEEDQTTPKEEDVDKTQNKLLRRLTKTSQLYEGEGSQDPHSRELAGLTVVGEWNILNSFELVKMFV